MSTTVVQQGINTAKLIDRWEKVCKKFAALAEEFPAARFDSRPAEGARSVAEVLRHVAFWNYYVADSARGKKADDSANEVSPKEFSTKSQIVAELKRSADSATEGLKKNSSGLSPETAEMLVAFLEHNCEHYGQLAVYARLNGITPPVSRT